MSLQLRTRMVNRSLALAISFMHRYVCPRSGQCSEAFKSDLGFAADILALLAVDIRNSSSSIRAGFTASTKSSNCFITVIILPALALCATLPRLLDTNDLRQGSRLSQTLSYPETSSVTYGNASIGGLLMLKRNPVRYGRGLKVESCRNVFNYMKVDNTDIVFADRSSAQPHDLDLPFSTTSSKCLSTLT